MLLRKCAVLVGVFLMTLFMGTLRAQTGKYSETASRTIDPMTTKGMVTSPNYLATQAGVDVLRAGGNAVDAAIAVASTLAVVTAKSAPSGTR